MITVIFNKNFATKKKDDEMAVNGMLARQLVNKKVASYKNPAKKPPVKKTK